LDDHPPRVEVDVLPAQREQLAEAQVGVGGEAEQLGVLGVLAYTPCDLIGFEVRGLWAAVSAIGGGVGEGLDLLGLVEVEHRRRGLAALGRCFHRVGGQAVGVPGSASM
jgi:hypothetical protein